MTITTVPNRLKILKDKFAQSYCLPCREILPASMHSFCVRNDSQFAIFHMKQDMIIGFEIQRFLDQGRHDKPAS